ncbi:MAG: restriction endonuclease subunit S [Thermodesulfobacteriota bacterium]
MADDGWTTMPLDQAVLVNPSVRLERGEVYPFVDMQAVDPISRSVGPSELREFKGGGSRFSHGDTLMARITPCLENGKIARYVAPDGDGEGVGHGSTEFIVIRGRPNVTNNGFAYYLTKWDGVRQYCISQMTGSSGRQRVPTSALSHREVTIPPLKEQEAIANILGALDDKIELNRRMNETLEAMARAIFKSWFVDFDPVRAKAEGRDPGLPKEIADLFPCAFEASELGDIPKGWRIQPFAETVEIIGGGTPKTSVPEYWNGDIPWFSVVDAPNDSNVWVLYTEKKITREGVANSSTRVLSIGTTIISARGTVGKIALVGVPMAMNQSCYGLKGKGGVGKALTYFTTRELIADLQQQAHGSVFDTITRDTLAGISVVVPAPELIETFEERIGPILERIRSNLFESRTLAAIRDALLPKLLSGEIRIKDAEKFIGGLV